MREPVRVAILDSGVSVNHLRIRRAIAGGITITSKGQTDGFQDHIGHGTAVCAVVQQMAPDAEIFVVKIFESRLATSLAIVLNAIEWCLQQRIDIINLSLGTANHDHRPHFAAAVEQAHDNRTVIVSAYQSNGTLMLPGSLPTVIGVAEDPDCPRQSTRFIALPTPHVAACPYPLDIFDVPRERNLRGVSFAVAHVTAHVARLWNASAPDAVADSNWFARLTAD